MNWDIYIKGFKSYLMIERSLSSNTIEAYIRDIEKLIQYIEYFNLKITPATVELKTLEGFLQWINELGMSINSQTRIVSGIKAFYKYLMMEDILDASPAELLDAPRTGRKLPDLLSLEEINALIAKPLDDTVRNFNFNYLREGYINNFKSNFLEFCKHNRIIPDL